METLILVDEHQGTEYYIGGKINGSSFAKPWDFNSMLKFLKSGFTLQDLIHINMGIMSWDDDENWYQLLQRKWKEPEPKDFWANFRPYPWL